MSAPTMLTGAPRLRRSLERLTLRTGFTITEAAKRAHQLPEGAESDAEVVERLTAPQAGLVQYWLLTEGMRITKVREEAAEAEGKGSDEEGADRPALTREDLQRSAAALWDEAKPGMTIDEYADLASGGPSPPIPDFYKRRLAALWAAALRSGLWKQSEGSLQSRHGFCCLGVLADLINPDGWESVESFTEFKLGSSTMKCSLVDVHPMAREATGNVRIDGFHHAMSPASRAWPAPLLTCNDSYGMPFESIAELIDGGFLPGIPPRSEEVSRV